MFVVTTKDRKGREHNYGVANRRDLLEVEVLILKGHTITGTRPFGSYPLAALIAPEQAAALRKLRKGLGR